MNEGYIHQMTACVEFLLSCRVLSRVCTHTPASHLDENAIFFDLTSMFASLSLLVLRYELHDALFSSIRRVWHSDRFLSVAFAGVIF